MTLNTPVDSDAAENQPRRSPATPSSHGRREERKPKLTQEIENATYPVASA